MTDDVFRLPTPRRSQLLGLALTCTVMTHTLAAADTLDVSPPSSASCRPALAIGGNDIKARKGETRLTVDLLVNGRGPYKFMVDSTADTSAVGLRIARDLRLPLGKPAILNSMTSREVVDRVRVDQLTLGPTTIRNLLLPALREADLGGDGLLGLDVLGKQRLMMDFEKHVITVEDARNPALGAPGEIALTARRQRGQLILTGVQAAGVPLDIVINAGSEITIGNLALRNKLLGKGTRIEPVEVIGVTGEIVKMQLARIGELHLGPVLFRDVPVAFADAPPFVKWGLSDRPALLLGTDVMSRFSRVSLDFRERKIRFQLPLCP